MVRRFHIPLAPHPTARGYRPLPSRARFLARVARGVGWSSAMLCFGLGVGVLGYRWFEGLGWLDALLNAAMLLGGEGPVAPVRTAAGKLFASFYAIFGGIVFVTASGVLLAPAIHRFLHRFHLETTLPPDQAPGDA